MKRSKEDSILDDQLDQLKRIRTNGSTWKEDVSSLFVHSDGKHLICYDVERSVYYGVIESGTRRAQITSTKETSVIVVADVDKHDVSVSETKGTSVREIVVEEKGVVNLDRNGSRWEGNVKGGEPFGYGVMYGGKGEILYKGFMLNRMRVCYGIEYYPHMSQIAYEGGYYDNQRHGYGMLYDINGSVVYQGIWKRDKRYSFETGVIDSQIKSLRIPNNSLSDLGEILLFHWLHSLKRIAIGNNCFHQVRLLELNGLSELEVIVIGNKSFQVSRYERADGCYRIVNCPKLVTIEFGDESFYDYHSLAVDNLPSLQLLQLGRYCFSYAPLFSLRSLRFLNDLTDRSSPSPLRETESAGIHLLSLDCF